MTRNIDLDIARKVALDASEKASALLRERFGTDLNVTSKGHADFVTELDGQCEEIIREELAKFDDSIDFMGEETSTFEIVGKKVEIEVPSTCWIVDPLDGTSNYSHSFGAFAVSIGLQVNNELCLGIVQAPVYGDLVHAIKGEGAFKENPEGGAPEKLYVLDSGNHFNIFSTSVPFRRPEHISTHMDLISKLFREFEDMRRIGAASLDLTWVASGTFAAFIERFLKPWDVAAGGLLVVEAGGIVTDFSGDTKNWLTNGEILATSSPRVHEQIMSLIE